MMETSKVDYAGRTVNRNGDEIVFEGIREDPTKLICSWVLIYSLDYQPASFCCSSHASLRIFVGLNSESGVCTSLTANFIIALGLNTRKLHYLISI